MQLWKNGLDKRNVKALFKHSHALPHAFSTKRIYTEIKYNSYVD